MKSKIFYFCVLVLTALVFFSVGWYSYEKKFMDMGYTSNLDYKESYLPFVYGDKECPIVDVPDDKVCILGLVDATLSEIDTSELKLLQTSREKNVIQPGDYDGNYYETLHEFIKGVSRIRGDYFDTICGLDAMRLYGGSGMMLELGACRYYYAKQYLGLLKGLEKDVAK